MFWSFPQRVDFHLGINLSLLKEERSAAGELVVRLVRPDAHSATRAAIDDAECIIEQHAIASSPEMLGSIRNRLDQTTQALDLGGGIVDALRQLVDKTKTLADLIDKVAKVRLPIPL